MAATSALTHPKGATSSPRRWRPSAAIRISLMLHALLLPVLAGAAYLALSGAPPGSDSAFAVALAAGAVLIADHLLLSIVGLWPRSRLLGPNLIDLHETDAGTGKVFLTIDDGPEPEITPTVLELLAAHGASASFFLIGRKAHAHPELIARIAAQGSRIENHSWAHSHRFSLMGRRSLQRELARAQSTLVAPDGRAPNWFRAPAGLRNPLLEPVLCRLGLHLAAWTRRGFDTRESDADTVLRRLAGDPPGSLLREGDILLLHDGNPARDADGVPVILRTLPLLLATCRERGLEVSALPEPRTALKLALANNRQDPHDHSTDD